MYRTRFGLTDHPLPKDAQGSTFCEQGPGHARLRRAFARLVDEPGLGVLVGEAGVGKTAALRHLCAELPTPHYRRRPTKAVCPALHRDVRHRPGTDRVHG